MGDPKLLMGRRLCSVVLLFISAEAVENSISRLLSLTIRSFQTFSLFVFYFSERSCFLAGAKSLSESVVSHPCDNFTYA